MARSRRELPPAGGQAPPPPPSRPEPQLVQDQGDDPVPAIRALRKVGDYYIYLLQITQRGGPNGVTVMGHTRVWDQADLDRMVAEACKVIDQVRLPERRKQLVLQGRSNDPRMVQAARADEGINARLFPSDLEFFEAVMADKFQFITVHHAAASGWIDPTVPNQAVPKVHVPPIDKESAA